MDQPTVSYCDDQAKAELILASGASSADDRKRHLDRAVVFANCSEEGRRDAERNGISNPGAHCCTPMFSPEPQKD